MEQDEQNAFEPLDERERWARKSFAWGRVDVLIGLLLIVGVAGWAGWSWWQQQEAMSNYRAGERYAANRDWEAARAAFLAAGDFAQARARAGDASRMISERDETYAAALAEREAGNWAAALRDFRRVQAIEPGFRDSALRERQAEQQVYGLALSGTVAVRIPDPPAPTLHPGPPGLYLYLNDAWTYLPGSDLSSQVRSNSPFPCVVYDTPPSSGDDNEPPSNRTPLLGGLPAEAGAAPGERTLVVVGYGGNILTARPLAFDLHEFARFTCDDAGVTGESFATNSAGYSDLRLAYTRAIQLYSRAFQAYDSEAVIRVPSLEPAWAILANDSRQRLVIGDYRDVLGNSRMTRLYISDSPGELSLVAERPAIVQAARFSLDGRFLVTDEIVPAGAGPEEHRLILLHLPAKGSPDSQDRSRTAEVLMSTKRRGQRVVGNAWHDAAFIESGPFAGKLLIERRTYPDGELRMIDPNEPGKTIWTTDQIDYVAPLQVFSLSGGMLLPLNSEASSSLPVLYVAADGKTTLLSLPVRYGDILSAAKEIEGRLVYVLQNRGIGSGDLVSRVFSMPLPGTTGARSAPVELVSSVDVQADSERVMGSYAVSVRGWSFGRGLLAYIRQGRLEVKTYDGIISLPLEGRVLGFYPLRGSPATGSLDRPFTPPPGP